MACKTVLRCRINRLSGIVYGEISSELGSCLVVAVHEVKGSYRLSIIFVLLPTLLSRGKNWTFEPVSVRKPYDYYSTTICGRRQIIERLQRAARYQIGTARAVYNIHRSIILYYSICFGRGSYGYTRHVLFCVDIILIKCLILEMQ